MLGAYRLILWLLTSTLLSSHIPQVHADEEKAAREKLSALNTQRQTLQKLTKKFKADRSDLQNQLSEAEKAIGNINREIRQIRTQLTQQQKRFDQLQKQKKDLEKKKTQQQQLISKQIRAAYQLGQQNKLKILLNQENPDELSRMLVYYDYFNKARSQEIQHYVTTIEELQKIEPVITKTTKDLTDSQQQLKAEQKALLARKDQRKKSLAKINARLQNHQQRLKQINADRKRLEKLLEAMAESLANLTSPNNKPFKVMKGKLPWPVKGSLKHSYGSWRTGGKLRWQGVILGASEGTEVKAIHPGRVLFADWFRGSGLLVIVDHGDGYMSLYAHNQSLLTAPGEWINTGDTIATVGNSGGRQSAGLYFEIRHNGRPSNPQRWCKRG